MISIKELASELSEEFKWHAGHNENNNQLRLKAGNLSMIYENGNIRRIKAGNNELLRMIYPSVRGKGWLTIYPVISGEKFEINSNSFRINFLSNYKAGEINFQAHFSIEGFSDNSLIFSIEGEALSDFEKNRIGFCILHPADYAGKICEIGHTDGNKEMLKFPYLISPHQPFTDIRDMQWTITDYKCSLKLSGDVFETEDHRNWTDASYKTYCTPLNLPYPVRIEKGGKINQKITFRVSGEIDTVNKVDEEIKISILPGNSCPLPAIGICQASRPQPLTDAEADIIRKLNFDHYRTDLLLFDPGWNLKAETALSEAIRISAPLELAIFVDDNFPVQVKDLIDWITVRDPEIALINIFHKDHRSTPESVINSAASLFKKAFPSIRTGSGSNANFTQVNRARPDSVLMDYLSYSIHPQEHASDNMTLVENLQAQSTTVESAGNFSNGKGIWVSPVNIQRRFNANIENYEHPVNDGTCPRQVDSRLLSLFGACWTMGSLKYICESGAAGVTYLETVGERGIIQGDFPSQWPVEFPSIKGMIFPVYFIFHFIAGCRSFRIIKTASSEPLSVDSLLFSDGNNVKMMIANFTSQDKAVSLSNFKENINLHVRQLNSEAYENAVTYIDWLENTTPKIINSSETLLLNPFSITFIAGSVKLQDI
jgi:hypothetical protein